MASPQREWKVLPHGQLTQVDENILTVVGEIHMPIGNLPRRMTVVRLQDRRLVVFSAVALEEGPMREIEGYGEPAFLIVPNDHHRLDARIWKDRYPRMQVLAPEGARAKVEKAVPVDATAADFKDPNVVLIDVPGTQGHEAALEVTGPNGLTLVLNDLIGNIRDGSGISGWFLKLMGFAGDEPHIPAPVKAAIVKDKAALRAQLLKWAALPSLKRILVSHGSIIDANPQAELRKLADSLA